MFNKVRNISLKFNTFLRIFYTDSLEEFRSILFHILLYASAIGLSLDLLSQIVVNYAGYDQVPLDIKLVHLYLPLAVELANKKIKSGILSKITPYLLILSFNVIAVQNLHYFESSALVWTWIIWIMLIIFTSFLINSKAVLLEMVIIFFSILLFSSDDYTFMGFILSYIAIMFLGVFIFFLSYAIERLITSKQEQSELLAKINTEDRKLFSQLAHRLKTPITIMRLEVDSMTNQRTKNSLRSPLSEISETIEDITKLSKVNLSIIRDPMKPIKMKRFMKEIYEDALILSKAYGRIGNTKSHVEFFYPEEDNSLVLNISRTQLKEALLNFIDNSFTHNKNNPKLKIRIDSMRTAAHFQIRISDNGVGFGARKLIKTGSLESRSGGLKIGLKISENIIINHKGKLQINSQKGKGTEIIVLLPLYSA